MSLDAELSEADTDLETSYDMMKRAVSREGELTDTVEERLDDRYEDVKEELSKYQELVKAEKSDIEAAEGDDEFSPEVGRSLEDAGQHLVNAYREATVLYNKGHSALENGEEDMDNPFTTITAGEVSDEIGLLNKAVDLKEDAFQQYDEVLQGVVGDLGDYGLEHGVHMHMDIGLGQQEPEV